MIFAKDPAIKSLADLKGKQLAIDMGGSQYQVVKIYTAAKGIDLGKDITVVNANFGVARAQLEAGRVDAALVIEPLASISAKQHPDWHVIFNGAQGWKEITGESRLGDRAGHARRRHREKSRRAENAARRFAGRRRPCSKRTPRPPTRSPTRR